VYFQGNGPVERGSTSTAYKAPVVEALFLRCMRQALEETP